MAPDTTNSLVFEVGDPSATELKSADIVVGTSAEGKYVWLPSINVAYIIEEWSCLSLHELADHLAAFDNVRVVNAQVDRFPVRLLREQGDVVTSLTTEEFYALRDMVLGGK